MKRIVIIPTYNEKENVLEMIQKVISLEPLFDILIVDDNSPDGTADLVRKAQTNYKNRLFLIQRAGKLGLGTAYIEGFKFALDNQYDLIFEMDCDFSHNPEDLPKLAKACEENQADLIVGSRYIKGVNVVNWPLGRVLMSYCAGIYVRFITGIPIQDVTAGFICYSRKVLEKLPLDKIQFIGYAFQIEMKFSAWKYGFKIVEIPIIFTDRTKGESKMSVNVFNEAIFGIIKMKVKSLFKRYQ